MKARRAAVDAVLAAGAGVTVEEALRQRLGALGLRDRGLARELVAGSVRRRASLDAIIDHLSRARPPAGAVREILRQALYQILFLDRIPDHAATDDAVKLTKAMAGRAAGYVNGVLRAAIRARRLARPDHPRAFAVSPQVGVGIEGLAVPDPDSDLAGNLALRFSYPRTLVERWLARFGRERCESLLHAGNRAPPLVLRVNLQRSSREMVLAGFDEAGIVAEPGRWEATVVVEKPGEVIALPGFAQGLFAVQGQAAQRAALLLDPQAATCVVDLCAAPGGKAAHLAELAPAGAVLDCVDADGERLARLLASFTRLGLPVPAVHEADARTFTPEQPADCVLVDAPCSNTGVLSRRLEARWRFDPAALVDLAAVGAGLLEHGLSLLAPGGRLLYSTCSLEPEENLEVVESVLSRWPELRLLASEELLPDANHGDGAFLALLGRPGNRDDRISGGGVSLDQVP